MIDSSINIVMFHSISDGEGPVCIPPAVFREQYVFSRVAGSAEYRSETTLHGDEASSSFTNPLRYSPLTMDIRTLQQSRFRNCRHAAGAARFSCPGVRSGRRVTGKTLGIGLA